MGDGPVEAMDPTYRLHEHERTGPVDQLDASVLAQLADDVGDGIPSTRAMNPDPPDASFDGVANQLGLGCVRNHQHDAVHGIGYVRQWPVGDVSFDSRRFPGLIDRVEHPAVVAEQPVDGVGELLRVGMLSPSASARCALAPPF
jgi:hypothetical protein